MQTGTYRRRREAQKVFDYYLASSILEGGAWRGEGARVNRAITAVMFVVSLLLVGTGAFYAGNILGSTPGDSISSMPADILDLARRNIPELVIPPKPAGREVITTVPVERKIQVPVTRVTTGGSGFLKIPRVEVVMQEQTVVEEQQQSTFVDATPEENAAWEEQAQRAQSQYDAQLQAEVKRISRERQLADLKAATDLAKAIVTDVAVPLLVALAGLVGAVVGLIHAFRTSPSAREQENNRGQKTAARRT